jgi:hypothetical protein
MGQTEYTAAVLADSPVGFWKLDEASGLPQDSSGNGHHFTSNNGNGTITYSQNGPFPSSKAIKYSGLPCARHLQSVFSTALDNITIECWVDANGNSSGGLVANGTGFVAWSVDANSIINGMICYAFSAGAGNILPAGTFFRLNPSGWLHLVFVRRATQWEVYVNGEFFGFGNTNTPNSPTVDFVIGGTSGNNGSYLSNVAYYTTALSAARIRAHYELGMNITQVPTNSYATEVLADSPSAFYKLDEASGLPQDSSGNGRHMTFSTGSIGYSQAGPFPGSSAVLMHQFNSEYFNRGSPVLTATDNISFEFWARIDYSDDTSPLFSMGSGEGTTNGVWFRAIRSGGVGVDVYAGVNQIFSSDLWPSGLRGWFHTVIVRRATQWESYLNGELYSLGSTTAVTTPTAATNIGSIGGRGADVYLSNISFYATALSPERIRAHYQAAEQIKKQNQQPLHSAITLK